MKRGSPLGRDSPLCRDPASWLNWRDLAIDYPRSSRLGGLGILDINALKVAPCSFLKSGKHMFQTENLVH